MLGDELGGDDVFAGVGEGACGQVGQCLGVAIGSGPDTHRHRAAGPNRDRPAHGRQHGAVLAIQVRGVQVRDHVGTTADGAGDGLVPPGAGDTGVVTGQQDRIDLQIAPPGGAGIDGVLQQTGGSVGLLDQGLGVAQDSGEEPAIASIMTTAAASPPLST